METDRFIWEHNDFLVLVSAGNDGEDGYVVLTGFELVSIRLLHLLFPRM